MLGFRKEINGATINVALQWYVVFPINILLQSSLPSFTTPTELNTLNLCSSYFVDCYHLLSQESTYYYMAILKGSDLMDYHIFVPGAQMHIQTQCGDMPIAFALLMVEHTSKV